MLIVKLNFAFSSNSTPATSPLNAQNKLLSSPGTLLISRSPPIINVPIFMTSSAFIFPKSILSSVKPLSSFRKSTSLSALNVNTQKSPTVTTNATTTQMAIDASSCPSANIMLFGKTENIVVTTEYSPNSLITNIKKSLFVIRHLFLKITANVGVYAVRGIGGQKNVAQRNV